MASKVLVRKPFDYDSDDVSLANSLECLDESLTVQDHAEDADINVLVKRFGLTGEMPVLDRIPIQEDFVQATDFHSAMLALKEAENSFMELPADLRQRFDHDPGKFVEFCSKSENRDELVKLGLISKQEPIEPLEVRVVEPKASPAA